MTTYPFLVDLLHFNGWLLMLCLGASAIANALSRFRPSADSIPDPPTAPEPTPPRDTP